MQGMRRPPVRPLLPARRSAIRRTASLADAPLSPENCLLAALPRHALRKLVPGFEAVDLRFGDVLFEPGEQITHVYFPGRALVSLLTLADGHLPLEVGLVGRDGMVGIPLILGAPISSVRMLVQGSGSALRMPAAAFLRHFRSDSRLQKALHGYTCTLMNQISQTAACNRFHNVEARLARWLLMTRDRVCTEAFRMTQEFLGHMLGVRRVGVTRAARSLQSRKLIRYARGNIIILDRVRLEASACQCYQVVRYGDDLPGTPTS